jgi:hypothetical protein
MMFHLGEQRAAASALILCDMSPMAAPGSQTGAGRAMTAFWSTERHRGTIEVEVEGDSK